MRLLYDYLIIGAGLFGSVFSQLMSKKGKKCMIIDKRNHIGGNCYTRYENGIHIHQYGSHVFHTDDLEVWEYIQQFGEFESYVNRVKANCNGVIYSLPINLQTLNQLWGVTTPKEAKIEILRRVTPIKFPKNAEEFLLSKVGKEITTLFYEGYTKKHWGMPLRDLPVSIYSRLPIRFNFDDNYYNHKFQGIPKEGYTKLFERMLKKTDVLLNTDYFQYRDTLNGVANKIVYSGPIDKFFNYKYGCLKYISVDFKFDWFDIDDYQGCAVVSHPLNNVPYTKTVEHKHFVNDPEINGTIVSKECPIHTLNKNLEPFYPVNDIKSMEIFNKYYRESKQQNKFIFGGRLAEYKYYDMHEVIKRAIELATIESYGGS